MQRNIKPKQINRTSIHSGQTGGKLCNDYDTHSTFNKRLVYKHGKCPFTGSKTDPECP